MAFGLKEAIAAAIIGSIIPGVIGGSVGTTASGGSLMEAAKQAGMKMFGDTLMGKITGGEASTSVANRYASVDFFDELSAADMGDALAVGKAPQAVDPETNNKVMTALLTKMLSDPAFRQI